MDEWKNKLSPDQYNVCRLGGTESPFSGKYNHHKENGTYGLDYDGILALTVKALQESNKKIFELETMIKELRNKIK
jgi:peptide methionine sulfoxide reductase MsrB